MSDARDQQETPTTASTSEAKKSGLEYPGAVPASAEDLPVITQDDIDAKGKDAGEKGAGKGGSSADSGNPLTGGFGAIRQVRAASKRHASAREQVKSLKTELEKSQKTLDHRNQVESNYQKIVSEQSRQLDMQGQAVTRAESVISEQGAQKSELEKSLAQMKNDHEEQLRPYRELMESTKGRADDAAKTLADAKRQVKTADQQLSDATKRREQNVASANRSVDNSQERLRKAEAELDALRSDDGASPAVVQKKQSDIVAERAHLDAARAELDRATSEGKSLVDSAQTNLFAQRHALETAETAADVAKREADERREEYERLYNKAMAEEKGVSDEIAKRDRAMTTADKELKDAQSKIDEAQRLLDEANDIHSTPEVTADLAASIQQGRQELQKRMKNAQRLARDEKHLRETTRKQRFLFIGAIVLAVLIVAFVVWFVLRTS
ncbi:MAG: hypothetical protein DUD33_09315 [Coriobacteriaceae bacterium]|nr:MAG: hypothetical protein DUD33_09315 [Coriobacteriaceae bacterium]